jgi:RNA recognition motif-containing protein
VNDDTRKLYVGGLPWETTQDLLADIFNLGEKAAESIYMPTDKDTGEFRGFAFVTMRSQEKAKIAMTLFDGFLLGKRTIRVRAAEPKR